MIELGLGLGIFVVGVAAGAVGMWLNSKDWEGIYQSSERDKVNLQEEVRELKSELSRPKSDVDLFISE